MHDDRVIVEDRLHRALTERLRPAVHRIVASLEIAVWHVGLQGGEGREEPVAPGLALPGPTQRSDVAYRPVDIGEWWGPAWGTSWFHLTGTVPADVVGRRVELVVDLGWDGHSPGFQAEGLLYRPDGSVVKALNPQNCWAPVAEVAAGDEVIDLYVEAAANPQVLGPDGFRPTPLGERDTAGESPLYRLSRADICVHETEVWELVNDFDVLGGLMHELSESDPRRWDIVRAVERSLDRIDLDTVETTATAARAELTEVLSRPAQATAHRISAVGHAHIDTAWLWPLRETVRKVARTTANVVELMDEDPNLVYAMSSAQQFAWLEEHRPEVFDRVVEKVRAGRFLPVGGMWVESDTNMPGSEAMARQFVYGKRYFLDTFGIDTQEVWLPDSFGYSAALPQLVRLSGSRWFLTQKISWNTINPFPHHTFWWEGLDGTRVFTHFPPVDTYNSELTGAELAHAVRNFRDKGGSSRSLVPFGFGDGGGGPTREMLARARRTNDLEGSPRVHVESPAEFFAAAHAEYADAAVWVGELYLEMHRGTYTSQLASKQGNRRSEHLLREAELWSTTAALAGLVDYPYETLDRIWKTVLLHQFHDILPGTSIAWVHREATDTYGQVIAELEHVIALAQQALAGDPAGELDEDAVVVFNAAPHPRSGVPALAAGVAQPSSAAVTVDRLHGDLVLDNGCLMVVIDHRGLLTSVLDLEMNREVLAPGQVGNLLQLHPDSPNKWDAWDLDEFYRNTVTDLTEAESVRLLPDGATVQVVRRFADSKVVQEIALTPRTKRVDIRTEVDWHEREKVLKAAFPVDVHTARAAYETQFGHLYRATHENTSWEYAQFEVCAHRFVHVGETGYGVAVVNDSTYGHDVRRWARAGGGTTTTVRLSLLRAPQFPDPQTDQGTHVMHYALVPGADLGDAVREGYAINLPERRVPGSGEVAPVVRIEDSDAVMDAVTVEAVKLADDRSGDVIVRLYESLGGRSQSRVVPGFTTADVQEVDLLERPLPGDALVMVEGGVATLRVRPFQIVTLRLRPAARRAPR